MRTIAGRRDQDLFKKRSHCMSVKCGCMPASPAARAFTGLRLFLHRGPVKHNASQLRTSKVRYYQNAMDGFSQVPAPTPGKPCCSL